jgi:hypothetical protein
LYPRDLSDQRAQFGIVVSGVCFGQKERRHTEIGAPESRIFGHFGPVLTPWDEDL